MKKSQCFNVLTGDFGMSYEDLNRRSMQLVAKLSGEQRKFIMEELKESKFIDERRSVRKCCVIKTTYANSNGKFHGYILNIGNRGVFIETEAMLPVGEEILLTFSLPKYKKPFRLVAKVVSNTHNGMGVEFKGIFKLFDAASDTQNSG